MRIRLKITPLTHSFSSVRTTLIIRLHASAKRSNCEILETRSLFQNFVCSRWAGTFFTTPFPHVFVVKEDDCNTEKCVCAKLDNHFSFITQKVLFSNSNGRF